MWSGKLTSKNGLNSMNLYLKKFAGTNKNPILDALIEKKHFKPKNHATVF